MLIVRHIGRSQILNLSPGGIRIRQPSQAGRHRMAIFLTLNKTLASTLRSRNKSILLMNSYVEKEKKCKSLAHNSPTAQQHLIGVDVGKLLQLAIQASHIWKKTRNKTQQPPIARVFCRYKTGQCSELNEHCVYTNSPVVLKIGCIPHHR